MKLKKLFLLSTMLLSFSSSPAYCAIADNPVPLTNDTDYIAEICTNKDNTIFASTHMYFDMSHDIESLVGNRRLFSVAIIRNGIVDSSYFYAPKCDGNDADFLKIETENGVFILKSCKDMDDYIEIIEQLNNQFQKILADNPNFN